MSGTVKRVITWMNMNMQILHRFWRSHGFINLAYAIFGFQAHVHFQSGSTHSFINEAPGVLAGQSLSSFKITSKVLVETGNCEELPVSSRTALVRMEDWFGESETKAKISKSLLSSISWCSGGSIPLGSSVSAHPSPGMPQF